MECLGKYILKGRTYYKLSEDVISGDDSSLVDGIWNMQNTKGEQFKLLISKGGRKYTLYTLDGKVYLKGYLTTRLT